jgi:Na+(H+)/acetate symporter ActP
MNNQNLTKEQKAIRSILYGILAFSISVSFIVDFYALIDHKNRYLINISIIGIYGIVFYIGYKNGLINIRSTISAIIIVAIIIAVRLLNC